MFISSRYHFTRIELSRLHESRADSGMGITCSCWRWQRFFWSWRPRYVPWTQTLAPSKVDSGRSLDRQDPEGLVCSQEESNWRKSRFVNFRTLPSCRQIIILRRRPWYLTRLWGNDESVVCKMYLCMINQLITIGITTLLRMRSYSAHYGWPW